MNREATDDLVAQVQSVLKSYHKAEKLESHAVQAWPAIRDIVDRGTNRVLAARQFLQQALAKLQKQHPEEARLVHEHYVQQRSIDSLAHDFGWDISNFYRYQRKYTYELAVIIADMNQEILYQRRAEFFRLPSPVVGFEQIATDLVAKICDPKAPNVLILEGMGGLGKTTLSKLVAYRCLEDTRFRESFVSVLWTSAKQMDFDIWAGQRRQTHQLPINTDDLIRELARELSINIHGNLESIRTEVQAHCKKTPYLIIIDNLETVADMEALAPLIEQLANPSRILITSRDRALHALPPTIARSYLSLSELDAPSSYQLLREAAATIGAEALAEASELELEQIYAVTGGNPLALWLVAGQAYDTPWTTFIQNLAEHCPRNSTGYELYDYLYRRSWEQLSDTAQLVLFAMHRCEAGADYAHLLELSTLDKHTFEMAVRELRHKMLLLVDRQYFYSIHRLTFTFLRVVIAGWWE